MPAHRLWMKSGASGRAIDFHHPAINDDEYADGERPHGNAVSYTHLRAHET